MELELTNVITVSVAEAGLGVGAYNTSNLALFTTDVPADSFGTDGFKLYLDPSDVATDFGTDSNAYQMAVQVFSQQPNILTGGGYLCIIPFVEAVQNLALSGVPASGSFTLTYLTNSTAAINWNDSASMIQTKLQAVPGLESATVTGSLASESIHVSFGGVYGPVAPLTIGGSGLQTSGSTSITITPSTVIAGETMVQAIVRTSGLVQYFGVMADLVLSDSDMQNAASSIQALNKIMFIVSNDSAAITGVFTDIVQASLSQTRCLFYGSDAVIDAIKFMAGYAGRGLCVDFTGSNTTLTMNLKDIVGSVADASMTQTLKGQCETAGVDIYPSLQGVAKVLSFGANKFFDQVYNLRAYVGDIQIALFNYLAETATKQPQTESGMDGYKGSARQVSSQYVNNQYIAPGVWNSPTIFGNPTDFIANIAQVGFYIYTTPIALQLQSDRAARKAPLMQIALKEAGAIQKGNVIINVNA